MSNPTQDIPRFLLAPQQEQLFVLQDGVAVTQAVVFLAGGVSESELRAALTRVVERHEILRTTFARLPGMRVPQQVVRDELPFAWTVSDRRGDDAGALLETVLAAEADGLDLEQGPIMRAALQTLPTSERALVLTAPAASMDAASMILLIDELGRLCQGRDEDEEPVQFADYAEWRRQLVADGGPEVEAARSWWAREPAWGGPLLFGKLGAGGASPERLRFSFAREEVGALRAAAQSSRVTEALFLEACVHALVARLSGETELELAGLSDGRTQLELAGALGPYAQHVPIRSRVDPPTTFAELVDQLRRARSDAARWQDYASSQQLGFSSRATTGFAYHSIALADDSISRGRLEQLATSPGPVGLELTFHAGPDDLAGEVVYAPSCYDAVDVERIAECFSTLALSAAADPTRPIATLSLLGEERRAEVLRLGDGGREMTPGWTVHHAFEERAAVSPDTLAVTDGSAQLTYGDLNTEANRLAHRLRALGVGRGQAVGLCFDRSAAVVVGLLGILKSGAAFVPLNFEHPAARLAHQLEEAEVAALVTQEGLLEHVRPFSGPVVCLDRDQGELGAEPGRDPEHVTEPGDVAYIMYTSGSTGLPKGVVVTHGNVANYTARLLDRLEADGAGLHFAVVSALSTDLGYTSIFPPLVGGGSIHLIGPEVVVDPDAFAAYADAHPIDVLKITPSLLTALLSTGTGAVLPHRWLVCGGEPLTFELLDRIRAFGSECRILNHYGPTEATIGACVGEAVAGASSPSATVPIGHPLGNVRAYVVDAAGEPTPAGVAGELWIGGAGVANGYVNRPEETAERFSVDPFAGSPDARIYRTGDRVRFLPDGSVEFLGRIDQQVKIRGYRVEPGEIETVLLRHPAVHQAAVVARGASDDLRLVAYVVASSQPGAEELRSFLDEWLPAYMIPSIVPIDALPLTPSGKVDRNALPDPADGKHARDDEYLPPRNELEREIADIWQELLGLSRVGVTDDFFALGGHSLLATQMITRIRRRHGNIPLRVLFTAPTVAALAEAVEGARDSIGEGAEAGDTTVEGTFS